MSFIREQFVIILGICLPLILIGIFLIAKNVSEKLVDPPQYKAVYLIQDYSHYGDLKFSVKDGKLTATYKDKQDDSDESVINATLFIYDPATDNTKTTPIDIPTLEKNETVSLQIPGIEHLSFQKGKTAPDGYHYLYKYRNGGLFMEIFGGHSSRNSDFLHKKGRYISLPTSSYRYADVDFIGWVIEENGATP